MKILVLTLLTAVSWLLPADDDAVIAAQRPLYPLDRCLVSDEPLGSMGDTLEVVHDGRLVKLCCGGCTKQLRADPAPLLAKLDAAVVAAQKPHYPLETCLVSDEAFGGDMGDPVDFIHEGRYVKLCCKGCVKQLREKPAAFLAKLDAATMAAQREDYPLDTCIVSGEALGEDPIDVLHGTTLVRLCCNGCKRELEAHPETVVAAVHAAWMRSAGDHGAARDGEHDGGREHGGEHHGAGEHDRDAR